MIWGLNPERVRDYSLLKNVQCHSGVQPVSRLMGTSGIFFGGKVVIPHLLVPRLRMSRTVPALPHAFMSCAWPLLPLCVNIMTINQL